MSPARRARALLAALAAFAPAGAREPVCSSLDGPFCPLINQRPVPAPPSLKVHPVSKLADVIGSLASRPDADGGFTPVRGRFEVAGRLDAEGLADGAALRLRAGRWIEQPDGWVTVGLLGQFRNATFSGAIVDGRGKRLGGCSSFVLRKRADDADGGGDVATDVRVPADVAGLWQGFYSWCAGARALGATREPDKESDTRMGDAESPGRSLLPRILAARFARLLSFRPAAPSPVGPLVVSACLEPTATSCRRRST